MIHPLAITMWDFSWIERRWDGAGFEDWNAALDGVKERGYDAVRIDAFPTCCPKPLKKNGCSCLSGIPMTGAAPIKSAFGSFLHSSTS